MDSIRLICPRNVIMPEMLTAAYIYGLDRTPRPAEIQMEGNVMTLNPPGRESIRLNFPWTIPDVGHQLVSTGTLVRREQPYYLSVELARGLCVSVRNQAADWEVAGLAVSEDFWKFIFEAGRRMHQAACFSLQEDATLEQIDLMANASMQFSSKAALLLAQQYVDRVLALRHSAIQAQHSLNAIQEQERFSTDETDAAGCSVLDDEEVDVSESGTAVHAIEAVPPKYIGSRLNNVALEKEVKGLFLETFNTVTVSLNWKRIFDDPEELDRIQHQIDWAYSNGYYVAAGPILDFSAPGLPELVTRTPGDMTAICFHVREHVQHVVKRFRNKVKMWIASGRVNTHFALGLSPMQQLELTARVMTWIREFHPTSKIGTSIDQPWGDGFLPPPIGVTESHEALMTPITCAEILIRSRFGPSTLVLEFNVGYRDRATYDRPLVEWSRLIDAWSQFRIPLFLSFRVPSACTRDLKATVPTPPIWQGWNIRQQNLFAGTVLPLALAKPLVYGVGWAVFRDYCAHDYPNSGLITADGRVKKTQNTLALLQRKFNLDDDA